MLHTVVLLCGTAEAADRERRRNLHHQTWTRNAGVAQAHFPKLSAPTAFLISYRECCHRDPLSPNRQT